MAKIGLLMLNKGRWMDEQLVSEEWIDQSSQSHVKLPGPFDGYGYLWWKQVFQNNLETYFSSGNGGQDIFIIPSEEMVIVFTTGNKNTSLGLQNFDMLIRYILPAIK
jgi:CubicO group peptidase (beta-lactamase class C family)